MRLGFYNENGYKNSQPWTYKNKEGIYSICNYR